MDYLPSYALAMLEHVNIKVIIVDGTLGHVVDMDQSSISMCVEVVRVNKCL